MKQRLVITAARLLAATARILPRSDAPGCLIVPPAGPGSLGDEAMVEGVAGALAAGGHTPVRLVAREGKEPWPSVEHVDEQLAVPRGGVRRLLWFIRQAHRHERVFVVGADCVDGHYSPQNSVQLLLMADLAARAGSVSTLLGSSYKDNAHPSTAWMLRTMSHRVRLCARDPVSGERMKAASGRTPRVVADAAFLLQPGTITDDLRPTIDWIDRQHSAGRVVLGVNFNRQVLTPDREDDRARLLESYASTLARLAREDDSIALLMIPHDYRSETSDLTQGLELLDALRDEIDDERVECVPGRQSPGRLKAVADRVDAVLTGRMHFAIASLGRGAPVACVSYQGKFEGLMSHFGLEGVIISPDEAIDPDKLFRLVRSLLDRRVALALTIRQALPRVRAMSLENLPENARPAVQGGPSPQLEAEPAR